MTKLVITALFVYTCSRGREGHARQPTPGAAESGPAWGVSGTSVSNVRAAHGAFVLIGVGYRRIAVVDGWAATKRPSEGLLLQPLLQLVPRRV